MRRPEEALHRACAAVLRARLAAPWMFFHPANGGARSKAEAGILKALGVRAGMPDLILFGPGAANTRVIAMELKAPPAALKSGGLSTAAPRLSDAQRQILADLEACGVATAVVRSVDELESVLASLGVPLKGRAM